MPLVLSKVQGSKETALHDFAVTLDGLNIEVSAGTYWEGDEQKYHSDTGATVALASPAADTIYELWINADGLNVLSAPGPDQLNYDAIDPYLIRLLWFTMPAGATDLSAIDINMVVIDDAG